MTYPVFRGAENASQAAVEAKYVGLVSTSSSRSWKGQRWCWRLGSQFQGGVRRGSGHGPTARGGHGRIAELIGPYCRTVQKIEPFLTLYGLEFARDHLAQAG